MTRPNGDADELVTIDRREFLRAATVVAIAGVGPPTLAQERNMYGLIGKMTVAAGRRDELIGILLEGTADMPGCLSYVVARDAADADTIWITEVWDSKTSHDASLALPSVKAAIAKGRPLITGFGEGVVTMPAGGHGLTSSKGL